MPVEREISELDASTDISLSSILHTKDSEGSDVRVTMQSVLDLRPDPTLTDLIPDTGSAINSGVDNALFADASDGYEIKRIAFPDFITALGIPAITGSITSNAYNIGELQLRWGNITSTTDANESFDFATPFTNECFGVITVRTGADAESDRSIFVTSCSTTSFIINRNDNVSGDIALFYFGLGR